MIKLKTHIALLLLSLFCFPTAFQSVHVLEHHSDTTCRDHHHSQQEQLKALELGIDQLNITDGEQQKTCLVCNFHFSINNLPEHHVYRTVVPTVSYQFATLASQQYKLQQLNRKSPRVSPVVSV